jgi:hypothetical protein
LRLIIVTEQVGKEWQQRSCRVVARGDGWSLEVREVAAEGGDTSAGGSSGGGAPDCIQQCSLADVRLRAEVPVSTAVSRAPRRSILQRLANTPCAALNV